MHAGPTEWSSFYGVKVEVNDVLVLLLIVRTWYGVKHDMMCPFLGPKSDPLDFFQIIFYSDLILCRKNLQMNLLQSSRGSSDLVQIRCHRNVSSS